METLLTRLRDLVKTETVVGEPIVAGDVTLIPISRISIGFGAGGNESSGKGNQGGAAGIKVEPQGFVVISEGKAQILPLKGEEPALYKLVDVLPDIWETVRSFLDGSANDGTSTDGGANDGAAVDGEGEAK
jgi:uncharacterized spore protein YtfJ